MIDEKKLSELKKIFDHCTHEHCEVHKVFPELKSFIEKLWRVARAAEAFIAQNRKTATLREMLDVDGNLAVALAALKEEK